MAEVTVSIDAELAVEVMVLAGVKSPQDAVELAVRASPPTATSTGTAAGNSRQSDPEQWIMVG
ncbi:DUF2191 domain-containing protein [Streptomyces albidoflavus]